MTRYGLVFMLLLCGLFSTPVLPHGHFYEPACCAGHDCWQIPDDAVKEVRSGWMVSLPGLEPFVIPFAEARPSGDEHFREGFEAAGRA
jgi:hypothetical protein